jgi:hypothetical protein
LDRNDAGYGFDPMRPPFRRDRPTHENHRPIRRQSLRGKTVKIDTFFGELKQRMFYNRTENE